MTIPETDGPREWILKAECRDYEPDLFFPDPSDKSGRARAEAICRRCPVIEQCRAERVRTKATHGVWAGEYIKEKNFRTNTDQLKPCGTAAAYQRHLQRGETPCAPCTRANKRKSAEYYARYAAKKGSAS